MMPEVVVICNKSDSKNNQKISKPIVAPEKIEKAHYNFLSKPLIVESPNYGKCLRQKEISN